MQAAHQPGTRSAHPSGSSPMTTTAPTPLLYAFPLMFLCCWIVVTSLFRIRCGFSWKESRRYADSRAIERVNFGSGRFRGIGFNNCIHVCRLDDGYLLRISRIFLGGSRFIADGEIVSAATRKSFFGHMQLIITLKDETMVFYGDAIALLVRHLKVPVTAPGQ